MLDVHVKSKAALAVLPSPEFERWLHLCFGPQVLVFQSLIFQRGTEQSIHRGTNFVGLERWGFLIPVAGFIGKVSNGILGAARGSLK